MTSATSVPAYSLGVLEVQVSKYIDVALTGIDGQSRTSDEAVERPLQARYDQKMAKYGQVADRNDLRLAPAAFSHTG